MPSVRLKLAEAENAILESNSMLQFLRPDLYLTVLDPGTRDFKRSAQKFLDLADGIIMHTEHGDPLWSNVLLDPVAQRPMFRIEPPEYVTPELREFVRKRLQVRATL